MELSSSSKSKSKKPHSKHINSADQLSSKTPEKQPTQLPRNRLRNRGVALSVNEVRKVAETLRPNSSARRQIQSWPTSPEIPEPHKSKKPLPHPHATKLPEKYEILAQFFDSLDSSIRLLRLKGSSSSFTNICPKIECLTDSDDDWYEVMKFVGFGGEFGALLLILMDKMFQICSLFLNSHTSGVVLEDFNSVFSNKFYHSHLDDISNINSSAVVAAASLVARTLYILASDNNTLSSSALTAINVNVSLVEELMGCLFDCDPGLSCNLVKNYISPTNTCPSHYVGVILDEPSSTPYLGYVDDVSRFLWNFLADRTSIPRENSSSTCSKGCNNGEVCVRAETEGKGVCVISTTRYVPAYSTRLKFDSEAWIVLPPNSSDPMGMVDPVWTESNWNAIGLRVYTVQNGAYDNLVLLGGIAVTVLAYLAIVITRAFITKSLKRD
nr:nicastrin-like [Quercus suber]